MRVHLMLLAVAAGAAMTVGSALADGAAPHPNAAPAVKAPAAKATPAPANRQYSLQAGAAATVAPQTAPAPRTTTVAPRRYRSYSYAPAGYGYRGYTRGYSFGRRDAGSKARGDYTPYRGGNYIP